MPTYLLDIPNEIIRDVIAVLDGKDLKAVRLSCRRLSDTASAFLYKTLYLSCHDPNLHVFEMVSRNSLLISGVRELVIDDTTVSSALLDRRLYCQLSSHDALWKHRRVPYFPDDENDSWDDNGRTWSPTAADELHKLLVYVYRNHHRNRLANSDVAALREALPRMISLHTLVLTNRTADDSPAEGAQSRDNSSAVVKLWRQVGEGRRERPPFPPRVDWWAPLQDDEYEGDEVFEPDWFVDGASDFFAHNSGSHLLQSLTAQMVS
ncbi:hypothetical protein NW767_013193 [Fusarium falciforme]|nr:hypothetical protein NW767_013193 [Fusarium falciforme]